MQVKKLQKSPAAQERWHAYCDLYNGGKFDPSKASAEVLQSFIETEEQGGADFTTIPLFDQLLVQIKAGQRSVPGFKDAWGVYCVEEAGGVRDPAKHGEASLQKFLDSQCPIIIGSGTIGTNTAQPRNRGGMKGGCDGFGMAGMMNPAGKGKGKGKAKGMMDPWAQMDSMMAQWSMMDSALDGMGGDGGFAAAGAG